MPYPLIVPTLEVQTGKEVTWGTEVTKTVRRRGISDFTVNANRTSERVPEKRGSFTSSYLARNTGLAPSASESGTVYYQDIL